MEKSRLQNCDCVQHTARMNGWVQEHVLKTPASRGAVVEALNVLARAADHVDQNLITADRITAKYCACDVSTSSYAEHV